MEIYYIPRSDNSKVNYKNSNQHVHNLYPMNRAISAQGMSREVDQSKDMYTNWTCTRKSK